MVTKVCEQCGGLFEVPERRASKARFCGTSCYGEYTAANYQDNPRRVTEDHFWMRVDRSSADGCWLWLGRKESGGYGELGSRTRRTLAHRWIYEQRNGRIPSGLIVRHKCDNRRCVRPDHLELGTQADNQRDKAVRGRSSRGGEQHLARLTEEQVIEIRRIHQKRKPGVNANALARRYGVTHPTIASVLSGRTWGHVRP